MSRDLSFWRNTKISDMSDKMIYYDLSNGKYLECVAELPIEDIIVDLKDAFKEWKISINHDFENGTEYFQLFTTKQFVRADCYSVTEYNMNRIIDILYKYGCPLYDSAIDVRFE